MKRARLLLLITLLSAAVSAGDFQQAIFQGDFHQRLARIHQLPATLTPEQQQTFLAWLIQPNGELGEATLKNDLLNVLRGQITPVKGLAEGLRKIYDNPEHSDSMRDYALQHLAAYVGSDNTLWQAANERHSGRAGTALLALSRHHGQSDRIRNLAMLIAGDTLAHEQARISALRVCGQFQMDDAAPIARTLIHGEGGLSLQLAALATLGEVGNGDDMDELQAIIDRDQERLLPAARRALALLKDKHKDRLGSGS